jgi:membrane protein required for colicin V production
MDGFTIVDAIVLGIVALSAVLAYARGLVREFLSILGWVGAAVAAFVFAPAVEPLMREVPILRDIVGTSCELGLLAAFAAVFAVALILFSIFTPLLSGAVQNTALGPVDKGLGFLFGVARGVVLVLIAFLVYDQVLGGTQGFAAVDESRSRALLADVQDDFADQVTGEASDLEWLERYYGSLMGNCQ